jgi:hypothetical protein
MTHHSVVIIMENEVLQTPNLQQGKEFLVDHRNCNLGATGPINTLDVM